MPFFIALFAAAAQAELCQITEVDKKRAKVVNTDKLAVVDGDSVNNGRQKWRLLGLNAPEYHEPLADKATAKLRQALQANKTVLWLQGVEPKDRYGRQLGYLFNESGQLIAQPLLQQGLAFAVVVAPNVAYGPCVERSQKAAKQQKLGVWGHRHFAAVAANQAQRTGFVRWRGTLATPAYTKAGVWLEFEGGNAVLHIPRKAQAHFSKAYLASLSGKRIEATGWATKRPKKKDFARWVMRINHPIHITVLAQ